MSQENHQPNPALDTNSPASGMLPDHLLEQIGRGILLSIDQSTALYRDSPPEAVLGSLLKFAAQRPIEDGRLEVLSREYVALPTTPTRTVELDLLLRVPESGAAGVVSIESHKWHRTTMEDHDAEIRRDREIRRYYPVLRYAAREVMRDPWGVLLDVLDAMQASWPGFESIMVPDGMRALVTACARRALPETDDAGMRTDARAIDQPIPLLERARAIVAGLASPPPTADRAVQLMRQGYPRYGAVWEPEEVAVLRDLYNARVEDDEIALLLGRTRPAIWMQLRRMGLFRG